MVTRITPGGTPEPAPRKRAKAVTPEQRNNQMIDMSYDAAEQMIASGKATSQLLVHFLKQGTAKDMVELKRLEVEVRLKEAQAASLAATEDIKEMISAATLAMTEYKGGDIHD